MTIKKTKKAKKAKKTTQATIPETIDYAKLAKEAKKNIIDAVDIPVEKVEVPEWGLKHPVYIKTMSAAERDHFEATQFLDDQAGGRVMSLVNIRAAMLVDVLCIDPKGEFKIFDGAEDIKALGKKSVLALDRCLKVSRKLNGSTVEDEEALLKNSEGQDDSSG